MAGSPPHNKFVVKSQDVVAAFFRVHRRTVAEWIAAGCPADTKKRRYNLADMVAWRLERASDADQRLLDSVTDPDLRDELVRARIEKINRENKLTDYKIEEKASELVPIEGVRILLNRFSTAIRRSLETVQKKYGQEAIDPICAAIDSVDLACDEEFLGLFEERP